MGGREMRETEWEKRRWASGWGGGVRGERGRGAGRGAGEFGGEFPRGLGPSLPARTGACQGPPAFSFNLRPDAAWYVPPISLELDPLLPDLLCPWLSFRDRMLLLGRLASEVIERPSIS